MAKYVTLEKTAAPTAPRDTAAVKVYADTDAALHTLESDGTNTTVGAGGGSSAVLLVQTTLTNAQIKSLPTAYVELVAAPGAGQAIWPMDALLICDTTAGDYDNIAFNAQLSVGYEALEGDGPLNYLADGPLAWLDETTAGPVSSLLQGQRVGQVALGPSQVAATAEQVTFGRSFGGNAEPWENRALILGASNVPDVTQDDFTAGHASNSMIVAVRYSVIDLS